MPNEKKCQTIQSEDIGTIKQELVVANAEPSQKILDNATFEREPCLTVVRIRTSEAHGKSCDRGVGEIIRPTAWKQSRIQQQQNQTQTRKQVKTPKRCPRI